ncbi:MAG: hypothetical protein ACYS0I_03060 [Planctomycetota bacterium]
MVVWVFLTYYRRKVIKISRLWLKENLDIISCATRDLGAPSLKLWRILDASAEAVNRDESGSAEAVNRDERVGFRKFLNW